MKRVVSLFSVLFLFASILSFNTVQTKALENTDPLQISSVIGLTDTVGTFRMATQDGSYFNPIWQMGLLVSEDEKIFVVDSGESQIEVYNLQLTPLYNFGTIGKEDGEYMYLTSVNICNNGNLYMTDSYLGRITVTKPDGTFIKVIDDEHLQAPSDLAFLPDGSFVVADFDKGLLKFDATGSYIGSFSDYTGLEPSPDNYYGPSQIEVDNNGNVYVSASSIAGICKIVTMDSEGNHLSDCIDIGTNQENVGGVITGISIEDDILVISQINGQSTHVKRFQIPQDPKDKLEFVSIVAKPPSSNSIQKEDILHPTSAYIKNDTVYVLEGALSRLMVFDKDNRYVNDYMSMADGIPIYTLGFLYADSSPKGILSNPQGVRVDQDGNIFVGNSNFGNIVVFDNDGNDIEHIGKPSRSRNPDIGEFFSPTDVCFDQDGYIYVSDTQAGLIHVFDEFYEPWALIDEGFSYPQGLCVNDHGELVVVSSRTATLSIVDISEMIDEYAFEIDAYPINGEWPVGVSCNTNGDMYVALTGSDRIVAMDVDGDLLAEWGETGSEPGQLDAPQGTCVDGAGNVYVAETNGGRIQKFTPDGDLIWTSDLQWPGLTFITMDHDGKLYVTDCLHSVVIVLEDETAVPPDDGSVKESDAQFSLIAEEEIIENETFSIQIEGEKLEDVRRIEFGITLPSEYIEFESVTAGDLVDRCTISDADVLGNLLIFDITAGNAPISGSGTIATMKFKALQPGDAEVQFDRIRLLDERDKEITFKGFTSVKFTILKGDTKPPEIHIEETPEVVYSETYTIKGKTEADAFVTINEEEIDLDDKGNFSYEATLEVGENNFVIQATDLSDNTAEVTVTIQRKVRTIIEFIIGRTTYLLNGKPFLLDAAPFVHEGRTVLPIRPVVEAIDGEISWDNAERKVTIRKDDVLMELWIDKPIARINGEEAQIDENPNVTPMIVSGRTFLPLRYVAENLGFDVGWDGATQTITLTYPAP
jgi:sugar lactone lactonase YvrE